MDQEKDYSGNKGHGRSHTLYVDLRRGKPIRVEAGFEGRHVRTPLPLCCLIYKPATLMLTLGSHHSPTPPHPIPSYPTHGVMLHPSLPPPM